MPKIYEYFGLIFFFFSNEHEPIHVHVIKGGYQTVFELIIQDGELVEIRQRIKKGSLPLSSKDSQEAEEFVRAYYKKIIEKWKNFFLLKKRVRCTSVTKRI